MAHHVIASSVSKALTSPLFKVSPVRQALFLLVSFCSTVRVTTSAAIFQVIPIAAKTLENHLAFG